MQTYYNPEAAIDARAWLLLSASEKLRVVKNYHEAVGIKVREGKAHAFSHTLVEDQLARGFGPSCKAIKRLQEQGLSRHEAIHAVAAIVSKCLRENPFGQNFVSAQVMQSKMNEEINQLSAATWKGFSGG